MIGCCTDDTSFIDFIPSSKSIGIFLSLPYSNMSLGSCAVRRWKRYTFRWRTSKVFNQVFLERDTENSVSADFLKLLPRLFLSIRMIDTIVSL